MEHRNTHSSATITGRIDKKVHDVADLKEHFPDWGSLSKAEKMNRISEVEPVDQETVYNVTTDRFHQYFVDNLDPDQTGAKDNINATHFALGTDGASGTATSDTDLNAREYSETITDHADNSKDLLASTFVDSTEANGLTLDELGLFTGDVSGIATGNVASGAPDDVFLINHTTFSAVTKDNTKTVTFDVTLTFSDV